MRYGNPMKALLVMLAVAAMFVLAGCGSGGDDGDPDNVMTPIADGLAPSGMAALEGTIVEFMPDEYPGVTSHLLILSPGRFLFVVQPAGDAEQGNVRYERTGPDTGTVRLTHDPLNDPDIYLATSELVFDSETSGRFSAEVTEAGRDLVTYTGSFEIVDALPEELDLAPANTAEFATLLTDWVMEFLWPAGVFRVTLPAPDRFVLTEPDDTYTGNLAYRNTDLNSGRLSLTFDPLNDPAQFENVVDLAFTSDLTGICTSRNIVQGRETESGVCSFSIVDSPDQ